jgi:hypothetical protein
MSLSQSEVLEIASILQRALTGDYWAYNALRWGVETVPEKYGEYAPVVDALEDDYAEETASHGKRYIPFLTRPN